MEEPGNSEQGSTRKILEALLVLGFIFLIIWPPYDHYSKKREAAKARAESMSRGQTSWGYYPIEGTSKSGDQSFSRVVVTKRGTLWGISLSPGIYSDPLLWPLIYDANREQVTDPHLIYQGTKLWIPRDVSPEDKREARQRAEKEARAEFTWDTQPTSITFEEEVVPVPGKLE